MAGDNAIDCQFPATHSLWLTIIGDHVMSVDISLSQLTTTEKLELMERLWVDLSRHSEDLPQPACHGAVLDERRRAVQQGRTSFVA